MLTCQFIAWVLAAVKRFDAIALHAWETLREAVGVRRGGPSGRKQGLAE